MKHKPARLCLARQTIRLIAGGELELVAAGDGAAAAPPPTHGSTAPTCQSTKFNCC